MANSVLTTPHERTGVPGPPSAHSNEDSGNTLECINNPYDGSVLGQVLYQKDLKGSPAALATPMGTAIPGIGHSFNNKGDR
jgi:hypothetical protein